MPGPDEPTGLAKPPVRVTQAYRLVWVGMTVNANAAWKRAQRARVGMKRIGVVRR